MPTLKFTAEARLVLEDIEARGDMTAKLKKIRKALRLLEANPRHPSLATHKYQTHQGPNGEDLFEAYVENNTPSAWRIFWCWGPGPDTITIITIGPHP